MVTNTSPQRRVTLQAEYIKRPQVQDMTWPSKVKQDKETQ